MKKLIVALAAVAMTGGFAAKADVCRQECENNNKCVAADCSAAKCAQPERKGACPFDNLNLTDAQKEQFKALRAKKAEACKAQKEAKKQAKSECRRTELAEIKAILLLSSIFSSLRTIMFREASPAWPARTSEHVAI